MDISREEGSPGAGMGGQNWLTTVRRKAEGWGSPMSSGCGEWRNNRCKADGGRVVLTGGKDAMPGKLRQSVNRKGGFPWLSA